MASDDRRRPAVVTVAVASMALVGFAYLVDAGAVLAGAGGYPDRLRVALESSAIDPQAVQTLTTLATVLPFVVAFITITAALALLGCSVSVWAGHQVGRTVAWVVVGLALVGTLAGLAGSGRPGFSGAARVSAFSHDAAGPHRLVQSLPDGYPVAYRQLSTVVAVLAIVGLPLAAVLLAKRTAHAFFGVPRRPQPVRPVPTDWIAAPACPGSQVGAAEEQRRLDALRRRYDCGEIGDEEFAEQWWEIFGEP